VKLPTEDNPGRKKYWLFGALGALFLGVFLIIACTVAWNFYSLRTALKWWAWSHGYQKEVMAQPSNAPLGELKHIEWDGWGWAGQDTTVYLVFDPTDSLLTAARNHAHGKFKGIPCEVAAVSQLDSHWYAVRFYTNEFWGRSNELDCSGFTR
jgi:hypothetical protein